MVHNWRILIVVLILVIYHGTNRISEKGFYVFSRHCFVMECWLWVIIFTNEIVAQRIGLHKHFWHMDTTFLPLVITDMEDQHLSAAEREELRKALENLSPHLQAMVYVHTNGCCLPAKQLCHVASKTKEVPKEGKMGSQKDPEMNIKIKMKEIPVTSPTTSRSVGLSDTGYPAITFTTGKRQAEDADLGNRNKRRGCPICNEETSQLRRHVLRRHLPHWMHLDVCCLICQEVYDTASERLTHDTEQHGTVQPRDGVVYEGWIAAVDMFLEELAAQLGVGRNTLPTHFIEQQWLPAGGARWSTGLEAMMRDFTSRDQAVATRGIPLGVDMDPANPTHPVEVLYWHSLMMAISTLDEGHRRSICGIPLIVPVEETEDLVPARGVDAHCHIMSASTDIKEYIQRGADLHSGFPVSLVAAVDNRVFLGQHCPPKERVVRYQIEGEAERTTILTSYGIHPSVLENVAWGVFARRVSDDSCCAVGECGVDGLRVDPQQSKHQDYRFRQQIRLARQHNKPLILHIRHPKQRETVHQGVRKVLQEEKWGVQSPIHIHSFVGTHGEYLQWIRMFPRTIFGISTVTIATPECQEFLKLARLDHLVVESDAPCMRSNGRRNHSFSWYAPAKHLATLRGLPIHAMVEATAHIACKFYGLRL